MAHATGGPELTFRHDDRAVICPCLEVVLVRDTPMDAAMRDFYERAMAELKTRLTRYITDGMRRSAPLDAAAEKIVPTWLARPRVGKAYYALFEGEGPGASPSTLELALTARKPLKGDEERGRWLASWKKAYEEGMVGSPPGSVLRATFATDARLSDPSALRDWVLGLEAARTDGLVSGLAGPSLNLDGDAAPPVREEAGRHLAAALLRHPGLDWHNVGSVRDQLLRWDAGRSDFVPLIKRVNWLTIVGARTIAWLGGPGALRARLGDDPAIVLHEAGPNLVIQAGPAPELGDVGRRDFLPTYRKVASALRPARLEHHAGLGRAFSDALADEWLDGLDRSYD